MNTSRDAPSSLHSILAISGSRSAVIEGDTRLDAAALSSLLSSKSCWPFSSALAGSDAVGMNSSRSASLSSSVSGGNGDVDLEREALEEEDNGDYCKQYSLKKKNALLFDSLDLEVHIKTS